MKIRPIGARRMIAVLSTAAVGVALIGVGASPASAQSHGPHSGVDEWVSPHAQPGKSGGNCGQATFSSIGAAVAAAPAGGTVFVCPGTYAEDVIVQKSLTLIGQNAKIDATDLENGIQVVANDVTVTGFTVENANGEGVLVGIDSLNDIGLLPPSGPVLTDVTLDRVNAVNDDKGFNGTEEGNCKYAGDCGGGIHFNGVEHSVVRNSKVTGNADGILLTDDYAPNAYNLIENNVVTDNKTECGIVLPGHNPGAVTYVANPDGTLTVTGRNPDVGGVYDNVVRNNVTLRNGTATAPPEFGGIGGSGSGIGIFGSGPGTGAYDNVVENNYMAGNGLAGFTIHAHHPGGEDVNGNSIVDNVFDTNNVGGDTYDGGISDFETTAIAVYSVPAVDMTISGNVIRNNVIGIWLTDTVTAAGLSTNTYHHVGTPVVVEPAN